MIRFSCPVCKTVLEHPGAGDTVACPICGQHMKVPGRQPAEPFQSPPRRRRRRPAKGKRKPQDPVNQLASCLLLIIKVVAYLVLFWILYWCGLGVAFHFAFHR